MTHTSVLPAIAQAGLAIVVLLACVAAPRPGGAALLVPVTARGVTVDPGLTVLRAGAIPGSVLVRGRLPVLALLRRGIVPLGAPDWMCGR
jgi:hypothetical protein